MAEADLPVVYIVDDDTGVREGLSSLIRSQGFGVRTFASAQDRPDGFNRSHIWRNRQRVDREKDP